MAIQTICHQDGTDNFRPLKGATSMNTCDTESPHVRIISEWGGLGGFGDNEVSSALDGTTDTKVQESRFWKYLLSRCATSQFTFSPFVFEIALTV